MTTITHVHSTRMTALALLSFTLAACDRTTAPGPSAPVQFRMGASTNSTGARAGVLTSRGPLVVTSVQLLVGRAALGDGAEFGCRDCEGNVVDDQGVATLVSLPDGGGAVQVVTEQVGVGRYGQAEVALLAALPGAAVTLSGAPAGTTVRVAGTYNGIAFQIDLAIAGAFRAALVPPLSVATDATPAAVALTLRLPVDAWFSTADRALDPTNAADRSTIETNIRASFVATEVEMGTPES